MEQNVIVATTTIMDSMVEIPVAQGEHEKFGPFVGMTFTKWNEIHPNEMCPLKVLVVSTAEGVEKTLLGFATHLIDPEDDPMDHIFIIKIDELQFGVMPAQLNRDPNQPTITEVVVEVENDILKDKFLAAVAGNGICNCNVSITMVDMNALYTMEDDEDEDDDEEDPFADIDDVDDSEDAEDDEEDDDFPAEEEDEEDVGEPADRPPAVETEEDDVTSMESPIPTTEEGLTMKPITDPQETEAVFMKGRATDTPAEETAMEPPISPFIKVNYVSRDDQSPTKKPAPAPQPKPIQDETKKYKPRPDEKMKIKDNSSAKPKRQLPSTQGTDKFGGW